MKNELYRIPIEEFYRASEPYMDVMNGLHRDTVQARKSREKAMRIRSEMFDGTTMDVLLMQFDRNCVTETAFVFEDTELPCKNLSMIDRESIKEGYAFLLHAPMPDLSSLPVSKQYLADSWQTAFVDEGRNVLRKKLLERAERKYEEPCFISDIIAPGYFGMDGTTCGLFFRFMEAERIGMKLLPSGLMQPLKSFAGIFLILNMNSVKQTATCAECLSGRKDCQYCKKFAEQNCSKISATQEK